MRFCDDKTSASLGESEGANFVVLFNLGAAICKLVDQDATARRLNDNALARPIRRNHFQAPAITRQTPQSPAVQSGQPDELLFG